MSVEDEWNEFMTISKVLVDAIKCLKNEHGLSDEEVINLLRFHADFLEGRKS